MRSTRLFGLLAIALLLCALTPALTFAQAQNDRVFDTGYTIADDAIWAYFTSHGGSATFGVPISRELPLGDSQVQLFENAAVRVQPDGSVQAVQLPSSGKLATQNLDGLTVPAADAATAFVTPSPDQPNYAARLAAFISATVTPQVQSAYAQDVWGLPTSPARVDPNNPNFIYQRFQNGILMYDASTGSVGALPVGAWFKAALTAEGAPADAFVPDAS
jgi:hypothetical protein